MEAGTAEPPGSSLPAALRSTLALPGGAASPGGPVLPRESWSGAVSAEPRRRGSRRRAGARQITEAARPRASARRDRLFRRMLAAGDLLALAAALALTLTLFPGGLRPTWGVLVAMSGLLAGAKLFGLYDRDEAVIHKTTLEEAPRLFHLATLCTLLMWLADRPVVSGPLARSRALVLWIVLTGLLVGARALVRALALKLAPVERCLFIGDGALAETVRSKLADRCGTKTKIVAHLDLRQAAPWSTDAFSPGRLDEVREMAQTLDIHRAIVAPGSTDGGDMLDLVCALKAIGVSVSVLPRLLEVVGSSVEFDDLHGMTIMGIRRFDLTRSTALVKRAFDLLGASLLLLAAAPVTIAIAIAIKLDSRGPVLFRQLRVGRHGAHFSMFKFRTMVCDAEQLRESLSDRNEAKAGLFKIAADPRITRVGRLLRKSSLDELPQLLNVLRGEMSLVGPRPLVVEEDMCVEGRHRRRLELHPGMTGHWQILGPARVPLREMVAIDYLYVANWSLWTDVKILLRTIPHVLGRRGL
jgi:exopolysaccharide biosynthesis polyprenyl glycosylphosphotransferase